MSGPRLIIDNGDDIDFEKVMQHSAALIAMVQTQTTSPSEAATILMVTLFILDRQHRRPENSIKDLIHVITESLLNLDESVTMERLQ